MYLYHLAYSFLFHLNRYYLRCNLFSHPWFIQKQNFLWILFHFCLSGCLGRVVLILRCAPRILCHLLDLLRLIPLYFSSWILEFILGKFLDYYELFGGRLVFEMRVKMICSLRELIWRVPNSFRLAYFQKHSELLFKLMYQFYHKVF